MDIAAKLVELRESCTAKIREAAALNEKAASEERHLSADEAVIFDRLIADAETDKIEIGRLEKLQANLDYLAAPTRGRADVVTPSAAQNIAPPSLSVGELREPRVQREPVVLRVPQGSLKAFRGANAAMAAHRSGMWAAAYLFGNARAQRYCRDHGIGAEFERSEFGAALSEQVNTAGGYLVPTEFATAIIDLREEYGVFRRFARVWPMASDHLVVPRRVGGLTAYHVADNAEVTASDKSWDQVSLTAKKFACLCKYSSELAEDAMIALADDLAGEVAYAFATKEDNCGFLGDGTSTYGGIFGAVPQFEANSGWAGYVLAASGNDTFSEFTLADFHSVCAKLPQFAMANAAWYCSKAFYASTMQRLAYAGGGNTVDNISGAMVPSFLGYPVIISQVLPAGLTTDYSNAVVCLFGNLRQAATLGSRREITLMSSGERYFEFDQLAIRGTTRFDINVHDLGSSSAAGPIVALVGN